MIYREALVSDIPQLMVVRFSVKENVLSNPGLVTEKDCEEYITSRGRGWVCDTGDLIAGFAIADLLHNNIWALFVRPEYEGQGVGKKLHDIMLDWYFRNTKETIWLGTAPGTRAEIFYRNAGWKDLGIRPNGEIKFEMTADTWEKRINC